jgi:hypothetical protein
MPNAYLRAVYAQISPTNHLGAVNTLNAAQLKLACDKFNYVADEASHKGKKDTLLNHLSTQGIRNTDQLAARLNIQADFLDQLTDYMWLLMVQPIPPNEIVPYTVMVDPTTAVANGSMLSHTVGGFKQLGVAFRGDNRSYAEFGQVGFVARYAVPPGSPFHIPEVQGTVVAQGMCYDRQNRDFLNQTGVCVARNFVGSMKFISSQQGGSYLYAVQVRTGADTEAYQQTLGGTALWRPGEKAAHEIPKADFLASIRCEISAKNDRLDDNIASAGAVWFQYKLLSDWTFHGVVDSARTKYIKASTADKPKNVWLDFHRGDDFAMRT